jgi:hypothetical protein
MAGQPDEGPMEQSRALVSVSRTLVAQSLAHVEDSQAALQNSRRALDRSRNRLQVAALKKELRRRQGGAPRDARPGPDRGAPGSSV